MKKAALYTRTGDKGETTLAGGKKVMKDHPRVEAYGTLDELNACLGHLFISMDCNDKERDAIEKIMNNIITLGCYLAQEEDVECPITKESISELENKIDNICSILPPLHSFTLPIGDESSVRANICRTICRRAERNIVTLMHEAEISPLALIYVNRLSDYLYALSRILNNHTEKTWKKD